MTGCERVVVRTHRERGKAMKSHRGTGTFTGD